MIFFFHDVSFRLTYHRCVIYLELAQKVCYFTVNEWPMIEQSAPNFASVCEHSKFTNEKKSIAMVRNGMRILQEKMEFFSFFVSLVFYSINVIKYGIIFVTPFMTDAMSTVKV